MYTKKDILWLYNNYVLKGTEIQVLICLANKHTLPDYEWIALSEGVIKTNTIIYDHKFAGSDVSAQNLNWATKPYFLTEGEPII